MKSRYSGKVSHFHGNALGQHDAGNVLDAFHDADHQVVLVGPARRKADAAIAHHHGRDAVTGRRLHAVGPGDLAVVVGVDVDKARRDQLALGVDLFAPARRRPCRPARSCRRLIATSPSNGSPPVPSAIVPPRTTRSNSAMAFLPSLYSSIYKSRPGGVIVKSHAGARRTRRSESERGSATCAHL